MGGPGPGVWPPVSLWGDVPSLLHLLRTSALGRFSFPGKALCCPSLLEALPVTWVYCGQVVAPRSYPLLL